MSSHPSICLQMDASEQVKLLQRQLGGKDKALQTRSENAELLEQELQVPQKSPNSGTRALLQSRRALIAAHEPYYKAEEP